MPFLGIRSETPLRVERDTGTSLPPSRKDGARRRGRSGGVLAGFTQLLARRSGYGGRPAPQNFIVIEHFLYEYSTRQPTPHREPAALGCWLGFQTQRGPTGCHSPVSRGMSDPTGRDGPAGPCDRRNQAASGGYSRHAPGETRATPAPDCPVDLQSFRARRILFPP